MGKTENRNEPRYKTTDRNFNRTVKVFLHTLFRIQSRSCIIGEKWKRIYGMQY